jgi:hypothetical protein
VAPKEEKVKEKDITIANNWNLSNEVNKMKKDVKNIGKESQDVLSKMKKPVIDRLVVIRDSLKEVSTLSLIVIE